MSTCKILVSNLVQIGHDGCVSHCNVFIFCGLGVDAGDTIRVPSAGNSGAWGSASGDLFIKMKATFSSFILHLKFQYEYVSAHMTT